MLVRKSEMKKKKKKSTVLPTYKDTNTFTSYLGMGQAARTLEVRVPVVAKGRSGSA